MGRGVGLEAGRGPGGGAVAGRAGLGIHSGLPTWWAELQARGLGQGILGNPTY